MTPGAQLAWGLFLGCGLGLCYGFLRPLRRRRNWPADLLFVACVFACWIYFSFGVCRGRIRFFPTATLALGLILWDFTIGRVLRPVFLGFWRAIFSLFRLFVRPVKKFFEKTGNFAKKVFASLKKRGTMDKNKHKRHRRREDGHSHGSKEKRKAKAQAGIPV